MEIPEDTLRKLETLDYLINSLARHVSSCAEEETWGLPDKVLVIGVLTSVLNYVKEMGVDEE